ncbi:MAG: class I SAM-dependent methyltransferase [Promethearchaeota archaeon]
MENKSHNQKSCEGKGGFPEFIASVPKQSGKEVIAWLQEKNLINQKFKIKIDGNNILIPLISQITTSETDKQVISDKLVEFISNKENQYQISPRNVTPRNIHEILKKLIPEELHEIIPRSFDIIGEIAIIELNREALAPLRPFVSEIGNSILQTHPNIQSVFEKASNISGTYRLRDLHFVAGNNSTQTLYRENHCLFYLDVAKTFFTPRLSFERDRIAQLETKFNQIGAIWDMFCGIGPFFIQIAKQNPHSTFFATDINQDAIIYAQENISRNHLTNSITCFQQDVNNIQQNDNFTRMKEGISRIIMNLPEKNIQYLSVLPPFIHPDGCLLHIYQFTEKDDDYQIIQKKFSQKIQEAELVIDKFLTVRRVKPYSPALDTTVIDVIIRKMG